MELPWISLRTQCAYNRLKSEERCKTAVTAVSGSESPTALTCSTHARYGETVKPDAMLSLSSSGYSFEENDCG